MMKFFRKNILYIALIVVSTINLFLIGYFFHDIKKNILESNIYLSFYDFFYPSVIDPLSIVIEKKNIPQIESSPEFSDQQMKYVLRMNLINALIERGFTGFVESPLVGNDFSLLLDGSGNSIMSGNITAYDSLDHFVESGFANFQRKGEFVLSPNDISYLRDVFLFKSQEDLYHIGYGVVSYRERINTDQPYRRYNIKTVFQQLGTVKVLNPGTSISFLEYADVGGKKNPALYKYGYGINEGEEVLMYAGGVCGASTAIFQGILLNKGLQITQGRNHSNWYHSFYTAKINGEVVKTPGLDSTVFSDILDLAFKNVSNKPIVLVMNFDGMNKSPEHVFTLGTPEMLGTYAFQSKKVNAIGHVCYTWEVNGTGRVSCYRQLK